MYKALELCTPGELVAMLVEHAIARAKLLERLARASETIEGQIAAIDAREGEIEALLRPLVTGDEPRAVLVEAYWDGEAARYVEEPHAVDLRLEGGVFVVDITPLELHEDLDWPPAAVPAGEIDDGIAADVRLLDLETA